MASCRSLLVIAVFGLAFFSTTRAFGDDSNDAFCLSPQQREALKALAVEKAQRLSQAMTAMQQAEIASLVTRDQSRQSVEKEMVRSLSRSQELRNTPPSAPRFGEMLSSQSVGLAQAAHDSTARMIASGADSTARMVEARWPAQAQMYQTTADMQIKVGEMMLSAFSGGAGGGAIGSGLAGLTSAGVPTAALKMPPSPSTKPKTAAKPVSNSEPTTTNGARGVIGGAVVTAVSPVPSADDNGKLDCLTGLTSAGVACAKPALDVLQCVQQSGGVGPYGLNILACGPAADPSDFADCLRELWDSGGRCVDLLTPSRSPTK